MKRLSKAILLSLVAILVVGMPVLAAVAYRASYTIVESGSIPYDMLPTSVLVDNQWLADNGFLQDDALDTRIETLGGLVKPHMVATNKTLTSVPVPADSQTNLYFTTANTNLSATEIIIGYGGYITITDDDTLDGGAGGTNDFEIEQSGYIDTAFGTDRLIVDKGVETYRTFISDDEEIASYASAVLDATYSGSNDANNNFNNADYIAQTFTTIDDGYVTRIAIRHGPNGPLPCNISIRATVAGLPTGIGTDLVSETYTSAANAVNTIYLTVPYYLEANTQYALVSSRDVAPPDTIASDNTAPIYADGTLCTSGDGGDTWASVPAKEYANFYVYISEANVTATGISSGEYTVTTGIVWR